MAGSLKHRPSLLAWLWLKLTMNRTSPALQGEASSGLPSARIGLCNSTLITTWKCFRGMRRSHSRLKRTCSVFSFISSHSSGRRNIHEVSNRFRHYRVARP